MDQETGVQYRIRRTEPDTYNKHFTVRAKKGDVLDLKIFFAPLPGSELCFNISRFTSKQLYETMHNFELVPRDETIVRLDYRITGISENGAITQLEPERDALAARNQRFGFRILPYLNAPDAFAELN